MSNKATLENLLARKEQSYQSKKQFKDIYIDSVGLTFTIERQPLTRILSILDRFDDNAGLVDKFEMYKELIYSAVPVFHSTKLQEAYNPAVPADIVTLVLDDNMTAISQLGEAITSLYGLSDGEAVENVKN